MDFLVLAHSMWMDVHGAMCIVLYPVSTLADVG